MTSAPPPLYVVASEGKGDKSGSSSKRASSSSLSTLYLRWDTVSSSSSSSSLPSSPPAVVHYYTPASVLLGAVAEALLKHVGDPLEHTPSGSDARHPPSLHEQREGIVADIMASPLFPVASATTASSSSATSPPPHPPTISSGALEQECQRIGDLLISKVFPLLCASSTAASSNNNGNNNSASSVTYAIAKVSGTYRARHDPSKDKLYYVSCANVSERVWRLPFNAMHAVAIIGDGAGGDGLEGDASPSRGKKKEKKDKISRAAGADNDEEDTAEGGGAAKRKTDKKEKKHSRTSSSASPGKRTSSAARRSGAAINLYGSPSADYGGPSNLLGSAPALSAAPAAAPTAPASSTTIDDELQALFAKISGATGGEGNRAANPAAPTTIAEEPIVSVASAAVPNPNDATTRALPNPAAVARTQKHEPAPADVEGGVHDTTEEEDEERAQRARDVALPSSKALIASYVGAAIERVMPMCIRREEDRVAKEAARRAAVEDEEDPTAMTANASPEELEAMAAAASVLQDKFRRFAFKKKAKANPPPAVSAATPPPPADPPIVPHSLPPTLTPAATTSADRAPSPDSDAVVEEQIRLMRARHQQHGEEQGPLHDNDSLVAFDGAEAIFAAIQRRLLASDQQIAVVAAEQGAREAVRTTEGGSRQVMVAALEREESSRQASGVTAPVAEPIAGPTASDLDPSILPTADPPQVRPELVGPTETAAPVDGVTDHTTFPPSVPPADVGHSHSDSLEKPNADAYDEREGTDAEEEEDEERAQRARDVALPSSKALIASYVGAAIERVMPMCIRREEDRVAKEAAERARRAAVEDEEDPTAMTANASPEELEAMAAAASVLQDKFRRFAFKKKAKATQANDSPLPTVIPVCAAVDTIPEPDTCAVIDAPSPQEGLAESHSDVVETEAEEVRVAKPWRVVEAVVEEAFEVVGSVALMPAVAGEEDQVVLEDQEEVFEVVGSVALPAATDAEEEDPTAMTANASPEELEAMAAAASVLQDKFRRFAFKKKAKATPPSAAVLSSVAPPMSADRRPDASAPTEPQHHHPVDTPTIVIEEAEEVRVAKPWRVVEAVVEEAFEVVGSVALMPAVAGEEDQVVLEDQGEVFEVVGSVALPALPAVEEEEDPTAMTANASPEELEAMAAAASVLQDKFRRFAFKKKAKATQASDSPLPTGTQAEDGESNVSAVAEPHHPVDTPTIVITPTITIEKEAEEVRVAKPWRVVEAVVEEAFEVVSVALPAATEEENVTVAADQTVLHPPMPIPTEAQPVELPTIVIEEEADDVTSSPAAPEPHAHHHHHHLLAVAAALLEALQSEEEPLARRAIAGDEDDAFTASIVKAVVVEAAMALSRQRDREAEAHARACEEARTLMEDDEAYGRAALELDEEGDRRDLAEMCEERADAIIDRQRAEAEERAFLHCQGLLTLEDEEAYARADLANTVDEDMRDLKDMLIEEMEEAMAAADVAAVVRSGEAPQEKSPLSRQESGSKLPIIDAPQQPQQFEGLLLALEEEETYARADLANTVDEDMRDLKDMLIEEMEEAMSAAEEERRREVASVALRAEEERRAAFASHAREMAFVEGGESYSRAQLAAMEDEAFAGTILAPGAAAERSLRAHALAAQQQALAEQRLRAAIAALEEHEADERSLLAIVRTSEFNKTILAPFGDGFADVVAATTRRLAHHHHAAAHLAAQERPLPAANTAEDSPNGVPPAIPSIASVAPPPPLPSAPTVTAATPSSSAFAKGTDITWSNSKRAMVASVINGQAVVVPARGDRQRGGAAPPNAKSIVCTHPPQQLGVARRSDYYPTTRDTYTDDEDHGAAAAANGGVVPLWQFPFAIASLGLSKGCIHFEIRLDFALRPPLADGGRFVTPLAYVGVAAKHLKGLSLDAAMPAHAHQQQGFFLRTTDGALVTSLDPQAAGVPYATDITYATPVRGARRRGHATDSHNDTHAEVDYGADGFASPSPCRHATAAASLGTPARAAAPSLANARNMYLAADGGSSVCLIGVVVDLAPAHPHMRFIINGHDCGEAFSFVGSSAMLANGAFEPLFPAVILTAAGDRATFQPPSEPITASHGVTTHGRVASPPRAADQPAAVTDASIAHNTSASGTVVANGSPPRKRLVPRYTRYHGGEEGASPRRHHSTPRGVGNSASRVVTLEGLTPFLGDVSGIPHHYPYAHHDSPVHAAGGADYPLHRSGHQQQGPSPAPHHYGRAAAQQQSTARSATAAAHHGPRPRHDAYDYNYAADGPTGSDIDRLMRAQHQKQYHHLYYGGIGEAADGRQHNQQGGGRPGGVRGAAAAAPVHSGRANGNRAVNLTDIYDDHRLYNHY